jgi:hypothetical protein
MKKLLVMLVIAVLTMGALAGVVGANTLDCDDPQEPECVVGTGGAWVITHAEDGSHADNALVFRVGEGFESECNITPRPENVEVRAYVAQWAKWSMDYNGWEWYVRKPGTYYADCITFKVQSNGEVEFSFDFDNLVREDNEQETNAEIKLWFGYANCDEQPGQWYEAAYLGPVTIPDSTELHDGLVWKLWNKIEVVNCNSPGLYEMTGQITMTLSNQACWIDDETGLFKGSVFQSDKFEYPLPAPVLPFSS